MFDLSNWFRNSFGAAIITTCLKALNFGFTNASPKTSLFPQIREVLFEAKQTVISMVNPPQLFFLSLVLILTLQPSWGHPTPRHADSDRNVRSCHPNNCNTFTDFWCFNMTSRNFKGLYLTTTLFNRNRSM